MKNKFFSKAVSLILALVTMLINMVGVTPVMAADTGIYTNDAASTSNTMDETEEALRLRAEIDALIAQTDKTRETYKTDYWGHVNVTENHTGAWHTIYGHQARIAVAFKPLDGNSALTVFLNSGFYFNNYYYTSYTPDADGYAMIVGPWCNITYKGAYRMYYDLSTTGYLGDEYEGRRASFHVWIDYK